MDYKDWTVIGTATLFGIIGALFGPIGLIGGILLGAGIGTKWMESSDQVEILKNRVEELESKMDE
jgi:hypothetical protein